MSLVLATEYQVRDFERWRALISDTVDALKRLSAHHVVVYRALDDPNRVFVTVGIRQHGPLSELLRAPSMLEWFDMSGVDDLPSVFAGRVLEKVDFIQEAGRPGSFMVAGIAPLDDVDRWRSDLHAAVEGLQAAGVLRFWIYQALDDRDEVMILQSFDTEGHARRWVTDDDGAPQWLPGAGGGVYPPIFLGSLAHVITVSEDGAST